MAWADATVLDADEARVRISDHGGIVYRPSNGAGGDRNLLCPQPGTGRSLEVRFDGMRARFRRSGSNRQPVSVFVQPPKPLLKSVAYNAPPVRLVFELREGDPRGGFAPRRLREAAALVAEVRDRVAARLRDTVPERAEEIARYLIGRGATDADKAARVRIVPIPSIGHPHADVMIRRLAVYVPQSCPLRADDLAWACAQVVWTDSDGVVVSELQRADDEDAMTKRYENAARHWRSVTPLALTVARRRPIDPEFSGEQAKGAAERASEESCAVHAVHQALRHAGIDITPVEVRVQREPFDGHGEPAEAFAAGTRFSRHALWHVAITVAAPVAGPLVLGDGRYLGLGLMRPDGPVPGVTVLAIAHGLAENAQPALVAQAARNAMMARVQAVLPRGQPIPSYVSGHEDDGSPARDGTHRHIAVVADLPRRRILYIAPSLLSREGHHNSDIRRDHRLVERALQGMEVLRAGRAGQLALAPATIEASGDPLFAPARVWESVSDYRVTRHRRRLSDQEALTADVRSELQRVGWPAPQSVDVLMVRRGPRGGLSGQIRLTFASAQSGPLAIGRTAHKGGGLFAIPSGPAMPSTRPATL